MFRTSVRLDIYPYTVEFILSTWDEYGRFLRRNGFPPRDSDGIPSGRTAVYSGNGMARIVVWIDSALEGKDVTFLEILSHECIHASTFILDSLGIDFDADHDETLTYLQGYLFSEFLTRRRKSSKRSKRR